MAYKVYLGEMLLPVTPSTIDLKIKNQNKTLSLIDGSEINVLEKAGLSEVNFTFIIPQLTKFPYAQYTNDEFKPFTYFADRLEYYKINKVPFSFKVLRESPSKTKLYDTNLTVSLEDYDFKDDVKNGFDMEVSIRLKQYVKYSTKKLLLKTDNTYYKTEKTRTSTKGIPDTYVVQSGDTLWGICKKILGDGQLYSEIAKLNDLSNPNLIYPSQVIRLK